ncbi:sensor histidine kinase [Cohnella hashimotonis]|uniref:histidine kinase n=1 Tax=Cohnella hashimotonis TaxID=2826895 RepID=A0ABT6TA99_9BACL|nr:sensor histidine kinase [Cohnella hashimotonis]MDI4643759.1 sensor histidine kinase [Cohnella hashimotonis]
MIAAIRHAINRLRFRQKLVLSYLFISLIPILFLGTYSYNQSKHFLNDQAMGDFRSSAGIFAESIRANMDRYETMASLVLYNDIIQKILSKRYLDLFNLYDDLTEFLNPYLNMLLNLNKDTLQLTIYTENQMPEYGDYINRIERIEDMPWYAALRNGNRPQWFHDPNQLFLASRFPKLRPTSNADGAAGSAGDDNVLYIRVNNRNLFASLPDAMKDQWVFLVDASGATVYANQTMDEQMTRTLAGIVDRPEGHLKIGGTDMILIKQPVAATDWLLYCLVPYRNLAQHSGSIVRATLIVAGLCLLILIVIIAVFAKSMIRQIYKLNNWMRRVEEGELELRIKSTSMDEIGELTRRFGNMLQRINELINEGYKNKIKQKEAELSALKSQITPHFLYNTLSFINWKAVKSDDLELSRMVTSLSKFYRTALNRGDNMISVRDEIENMKSYVDIVLMTSGHRFDVVCDLDESGYEYGAINLILQPLVENAVKHGINKKTDGKGLLEISLRVGEDTIEFSVGDNGPGIEPRPLSELLTKPTAGYGLKNVDERIKLMFGAEYGLLIESEIGRGTCMRVVIPKQAMRSDGPTS